MPLVVLILTLAFAGSTLWVPDFGGFDPNQFPVPQIEPPVQPAGYAFAIWGVVYLWLLVSAVFGVVRRWSAPDWRDMRLPLALSLAVGAVWLPAAVLSPVLATVLIWAMLLPALAALWRSPVLDTGWASWPIGLYAGWLSAASCVAIGLLLAGYGLLSEEAAAILMLGTAIVLASVVQGRLGRAPTYGLGVIWALVAVAVQNGTGQPWIALLALFGCGIVSGPTLRAIRG